MTFQDPLMLGPRIKRELFVIRHASMRDNGTAGRLRQIIRSARKVIISNGIDLRKMLELVNN
jgi:hypothetical protein